jgi:hypothetical protein
MSVDILGRSAVLIVLAGSVGLSAGCNKDKEASCKSVAAALDADSRDLHALAKIGAEDSARLADQKANRWAALSVTDQHLQALIGAFATAERRMASAQHERARAMAKLNPGEAPTGDAQRATDFDALIAPIAADEQTNLSAVTSYCAEHLRR